MKEVHTVGPSRPSALRLSGIRLMGASVSVWDERLILLYSLTVSPSTQGALDNWPSWKQMSASALLQQQAPPPSVLLPLPRPRRDRATTARLFANAGSAGFGLGHLLRLPRKVRAETI